MLPVHTPPRRPSSGPSASTCVRDPGAWLPAEVDENVHCAFLRYANISENRTGSPEVLAAVREVKLLPYAKWWSHIATMKTLPQWKSKLVSRKCCEGLVDGASSKNDIGVLFYCHLINDGEFTWWTSRCVPCQICQCERLAPQPRPLIPMPRAFGYFVSLSMQVKFLSLRLEGSPASALSSTSQ